MKGNDLLLTRWEIKEAQTFDDDGTIIYTLVSDSDTRDIVIDDYTDTPHGGLFVTIQTGDDIHARFEVSNREEALSIIKNLV